MKKQEIALCKQLIDDLNSSEIHHEKTTIRNKLFKAMHPFIVKWISSISSQKGLYYDEKDILSKSWDCFEFALKHYKTEKDIPIPNHFYSYTRYWLCMHLRKTNEEEKNEKTDPAASLDIFESTDNPIAAYDQISELKAFRKQLPSDYHGVFDDALMSMAPAFRQRTYNQEATALSYGRYAEIKKIFKVVINFILIR